jgi:hypothetical protein
MHAHLIKITEIDDDYEAWLQGSLNPISKCLAYLDLI